jgi:hypothetical protein
MTYQDETEAIVAFVLRYKEMPEQDRQHALHKTKCLAEWRGTTPETRRFNAKLHAALYSAERDIKLINKAAANAVQPIAMPTFVDVINGFLPIVYFVICLGGVSWLAVAIVSFLKGTAMAVTAWATTYGGWIFGGVLGAILLLELPKIKFCRDEPTTIEKFEQETFYQKTSYEKTTNG